MTIINYKNSSFILTVLPYKIEPERVFTALSSGSATSFFNFYIHSEFITEIKISLFIAFCGHHPFRRGLQIRKIGVRFISVVNIGDMGHIAVRKKLLIDALSAADEYILRRVLDVYKRQS